MVSPLKASLCFVTPEGDRWRRRGLGTHASYTTNYTTNTKKRGVESRNFLVGYPILKNASRVPSPLQSSTSLFTLTLNFLPSQGH